MQTYCTHGYFNRNPFPIECHSYVPDFFDGDAGSTIYQEENFNTNSCNHASSAMEFLYKAISLPLIRLYGNICPGLFYIHINLIALRQL